MGKNKNQALARISGIKESLCELADEMAAKGGRSVCLTAKRLESALDIVCRSIDGDLSGLPDKEVAEMMTMAICLLEVIGLATAMSDDDACDK